MRNATGSSQRRRSLHPAIEPESAEEIRLRLRIEGLRNDLTQASSELEELRVTLLAFEATYDASVGLLIVALDQQQLTNEKLARTIKALRDSKGSVASIEGDINREFEAEQQRLDDEATEAAGAMRRIDALAPAPTEEVARAIRAQYRKLARQFHPDVAVTDDQRVHHEQAMKRINEAMENHDLHALHVLEVSLPARTSGMPGGTSRAKVRWATSEIERLETVLTKAVGQVAAVKASSLYVLWQRCTVDPRALEWLEQELRGELTLACMQERTLLQTLDQLKRERIDAAAGQCRHD